MGNKPSYQDLKQTVQKLEEKLQHLQQTMNLPVAEMETKSNLKNIHRILQPTDSKDLYQGEASSTTLQQSESSFRQAFQASTDSVAIIRMSDHLFIEVNSHFIDLTGYQKEEILGMSGFNLDLWRNKNNYTTLLKELETKGSLMNISSKIRSREGKPKIVSVSAMLMDYNKTPHILLVIKETNRLKQIEEALEVSEARFRELFNSMSSGVIVCKKDITDTIIIIDMNYAAERIENLRKEEVVGKKYLKIFPNQQESVPVDCINRVFSSNKSENYPVTLYKKNSLKFWKENYIYKLPSGEIIIVCDDITRRKKVEEKLLSYQKQLQSLASKLSLTEERERRSIATDLHDRIGQTLSVIKMKLHILKEKFADKEGVKQLKEIESYVQQTIQDTRTLTFEISPPVLYELGLEAAIEWLCEQFQSRNRITCHFKRNGTPGLISEDLAVVLFRAVRELLTNVLKHSKASEAWINFSWEKKQVQITVIDNGIGLNTTKEFSPANKHYAFGIFSIRERLRHFNGHFKLISKPGQGTQGSITLPLKIKPNELTE